MITIGFTDAHIDGAAQLFAGHVQDSAVGHLMDTEMHGPAAWRPWVQWLCGTGTGIALMDGDRMAGYMLGLPIDTFLGDVPGIYCPEYGHGAVNSSVYPELYRAAAERWVARGYMTHAVSVQAGDDHVKETLYWQGFGLHVVDAVLPGMSLPAGTPHPDDGIRIRLASERDMDALNRLMGKHWGHLKASPVFAGWVKAEDIRDWMRNENRFAVAAEDSAGVRACMLAAEPGEDSSALVQGEDVIGIGGAYVADSMRGHGLARRMLEALLAEAARRGYRRCVVDFEAGNIEARQFWLKYFIPVSFSVLRRIPPQR